MSVFRLLPFIGERDIAKGEKSQFLQRCRQRNTALQAGAEKRPVFYFLQILPKFHLIQPGTALKGALPCHQQAFRQGDAFNLLMPLEDFRPNDTHPFRDHQLTGISPVSHQHAAADQKISQSAFHSLSLQEPFHPGSIGKCLWFHTPDRGRNHRALQSVAVVEGPIGNLLHSLRQYHRLQSAPRKGELPDLADSLRQGQGIQVRSLIVSPVGHRRPVNYGILGHTTVPVELSKISQSRILSHSGGCVSVIYPFLLIVHKNHRIVPHHMGASQEITRLLDRFLGGRRFRDSGLPCAGRLRYGRFSLVRGILLLRHLFLTLIECRRKGICRAARVAVYGQLVTAVKSRVMNVGCLRRNADIFHIIAVSEGQNTDGFDIGRNGHLLQACTACKCIISHLPQPIAQNHCVQAVASPEGIGLNGLDGVGNHHQFDVVILLKGPLTDHLNRIRNRDIFLVSTIPYKRTSLHFKIGSRCCRICLRYRKLHDYQCRGYHQDTPITLFPLHIFAFTLTFLSPALASCLSAFMPLLRLSALCAFMPSP